MNCTRCGAVWCPGEATVCSKCAAATPGAGGAGEPPPMPSRDDFVGRMIPTGNKEALVSYYCAFGAFLPFVGPLLAIVAIVMGIKGVRLERRHPEVRGGCHAWFGIVAGFFLGLLGLGMTIGIVWGLSSKH